MRFRGMEARGGSSFHVIFRFLQSPVLLSRLPLSFAFIKDNNRKLSTVVLERKNGEELYT
jgi:hypothetical protein